MAVFLPAENPMDRSLAGYSPWGCKSQIQLSDYTTHHHRKLLSSFELCIELLHHLFILRIFQYLRSYNVIFCRPNIS